MFDSEQKEGSRAVGWPPTELSKSDDLNRLVLAGIQNTMCASGAPVEESAGENVRFWHLADISKPSINVCFRTKSNPLLTPSGL
jgi:hypothetical protein